MNPPPSDDDDRKILQQMLGYSGGPAIVRRSPKFLLPSPTPAR
jgi:hypothetical protein